ncbi:unnamed protein product [Arctia plantaginis]|uniref:Uncharacterized protein n=1 Tax=Arctia plantaginis TaxID=874455 RepID=A0A8S1AYC5_ARCPL|nr:unnamed protein product [Arctia plantaginis]
MNCHTIPKMDHDSTRPRSIIIQLQSPRLRDGLLTADKKYNKLHKAEKLHSGHLGLGDPRQAANRQLHAVTRVAAREDKFV